MTEEHLHIPIPQVIRGNMPGNIGIVPLTNICCVCGETVGDHPDTESRWQAFLLRERRYRDLDNSG